VRILAPSGTSSRPSAAICSHAFASASAIDRACSRAARAGICSASWPSVARARRYASSARLAPHPRLTAVGLARASACAAAGTSSPRAAARATPYAPAIPSKGAPRTTRRLIASISAGTSAQVTNVSSAGSLVWSRSSTAGPSGGSSQRKAMMLTLSSLRDGERVHDIVGGICTESGDRQATRPNGSCSICGEPRLDRLRIATIMSRSVWQGELASCR
jgi:hypothetical protein